MSITDELVISGGHIAAKSYAKINLSLDVLSSRPDGYHDVRMLMQTVSLYDTILLDKTTYGISVDTNRSYLPNNEKNIAYQAALLFFRHTGIHGGVRIHIDKNIPVAAGLAGGSGNGAAVLCGLNAMYDARLSNAELASIAVSLGADVPYCIHGGTCLAEGIGERLSPLPAMPDCFVLLVKPPINVSTAAIYEQIDSTPISIHPDTQRLIEALQTQNLHELSSHLCNVMESVTIQLHPVIGGIKEKMIHSGALGALMSGSGPTVFGLFDDFSKAKQSADSFYLQFQDVFLIKVKHESPLSIQR